MIKLLAFLLIFSICAMPVVADYKITQKRTIEEMSIELTTYSKGVRERRESKFTMGLDPQMAAMMEQMMPNLTEISQCDLKQDITVNPKYKSFFIDYHDWSSVPPEKLARRPRQKITVKGTVTMSSVVVDSGKRKPMFGLTARWAKHTLEMERSADSCEGAGKMKIEKEGWFVTLSLEAKTCSTPRIPGGEDGGCRPRPIVKSMQDPGFMLEGTTTFYENGKQQMVEKLETLDLSKATLEQSLFEAPIGFIEVDSFSELMRPAAGPANTTAITQTSGSTSKPTAMKTVAIDFFSGSSSKLDQNTLRNYIAGKLSAAGISGYLITSQADLQSGNFANVIAIDIQKAKESGASKIGGLFGKVTGNPDAAKAGESEAQITITIMAQDRKTVVATASATEKVKGNANDAVRAAIDSAMPGLIAKMK